MVPRAVAVEAVRAVSVEVAEAVMIADWPVASGMTCSRATRRLRWQQAVIKGEVRGKHLFHGVAYFVWVWFFVCIRP